MKLLSKTSLLFLLIALFVFSAGGFFFYKQLKALINEEATERLEAEKDYILNYFDTNPNTTSLNNFPGKISFSPIDKPGETFIKDTILFDEFENEELPFRLISFPVKVNNTNFECTIYKTLLESDDLTETILQYFLYISASLLLLIIILNRFVSSIIFKPFFKTVDQLNNYKIEKHSNLLLETTSTEEFTKLNQAIEQMTAKISTDFQNLKAFTENASHEIQTPLAIIKSKTELLLQDEHLNEDQVKLIHEVNKAANRLRKLNQSLIMLTRIENQQFSETEDINLSELLKEKINFYKELSDMNELKINEKISGDVKIKIHPSLADIVISNLFTNAIKYNEKHGVINITLDKNRLVIENSGKPLNQSHDNIFQRFYKDDPASESTGLGLALVNEIAKINGHKLEYEFKNALHQFKYSFN